MSWRDWTMGVLAAVCVGFQQPHSAATAEAGADEAPPELSDGWRVARPSEAGFDPVALAALTDAIEGGTIPNVHALVVERAGRLVFERYFDGEDERWGEPMGVVEFDRDSLHDLRSVTKSVTSALLGIALGEEFGAAVERPITTYFQDLKGKFGSGVNEITLRHVLTMTAGLEWNEMTVPYTSRENDEIRMYFTPDPVAMVLGRPVRDPVGTEWYYNGGLTQVVAGLIQRETGKRLDRFAEEALFAPLGITRYEWLGSPGWSAKESPSAASGLRLRARDLAKIGSLMLHGGRWNERQVIPADWVELSTRRYIRNIPWGPPGVYGYGFMWYPGTIGGPEGERVVRAAGNGDQRLFIVPDAAVVVTVFAGNYNDHQFDSGDRVFAGVMAARSEIADRASRN
jgi:CubicO group peptidase (beta-lactamase class C family)